MPWLNLVVCESHRDHHMMIGVYDDKNILDFSSSDSYQQCRCVKICTNCILFDFLFSGTVYTCICHLRGVDMLSRDKSAVGDSILYKTIRTKEWHAYEF